MANDRPAVPLLAKLAHASAPFLSTFLLVHLSAPALANVGGSSLSSSVMLLGREYYQTAIGERYLLFVPLGIHIASGLAQRLLARPPRRKLTSALSLAAYSSLLLLPLHVYTHRLAPTYAAPPILGVGPAELDYAFVQTALARFPWRSWALYAALVGSVVVHGVEGVQVLRAAWAGAGGKRWSAWTRGVVVGVVVGPVMLGLWTVSREPVVALEATVERYVACLRALWVYRV